MKVDRHRSERKAEEATLSSYGKFSRSQTLPADQKEHSTRI